MFRFSALVAASSALLFLSACQTVPKPVTVTAVEIEEETGWRRTASEADEARIDGAVEVWDEALGDARRRYRRQIEEEGRLLEPDGALPRPAPTPGSYRCRLLRFGGEGEDARPFTAYPPFFCHVGVDGDHLSITKQTGSERPAGYLFEDDSNPRLIFLGSLALGDDAAPLAYGEDEKRDMAGLFERVGPLRFRLVIPRPRSGSKLDVFELVPAPVQNPE